MLVDRKWESRVLYLQNVTLRSHMSGQKVKRMSIAILNKQDFKVSWPPNRFSPFHKNKYSTLVWINSSMCTNPLNFGSPESPWKYIHSPLNRRGEHRKRRLIDWWLRKEYQLSPQKPCEIKLKFPYDGSEWLFEML